MGRFLGPPSSVGIVSGGIFGVQAAGGGGPHTWTQLITGFEGGGHPFVRTLDFANGNFIIVAAGSNVIVSSDLVTWTQNFVSGFDPGNGVTFGAGVYVIVLNNSPQPRVATSPDLVTWTAHVAGYPSAGDTLWKPVFGNGVFLTVSQNHARYATSPDGASWTAQSTYVPNKWGQPIFDGTRFLAAVMNPSNVPKIVTSSDAVTWTETVTLTGDFNSGSTPFFVGNDTTTQYLAGESTDDAGNNIDGGLSSATLISYNTAGIATLVAPVFSGTSWARMDGEQTGISSLSSSTAGTTWFLDTVPAGFFQPADLAFGLGQFLAMGYDTSLDLFMVSRGP
jgi:hypothetical protein